MKQRTELAHAQTQRCEKIGKGLQSTRETTKTSTPPTTTIVVGKWGRVQKMDTCSSWEGNVHDHRHMNAKCDEKLTVDGQ